MDLFETKYCVKCFRKFSTKKKKNISTVFSSNRIYWHISLVDSRAFLRYFGRFSIANCSGFSISKQVFANQVYSNEENFDFELILLFRFTSDFSGEKIRKCSLRVTLVRNSFLCTDSSDV